MFSILKRLLDLFSFRKHPDSAQPEATSIPEQPVIQTPETGKAVPRVDAAPEKRIREKIKVPKTNRHGLPLIHPKEDLNALFAQTSQKEPIPEKTDRIRPRNRHGIRRISPSDDLFRLFGEQNPDETRRSGSPDDAQTRVHRRFGQGKPAENNEFARMLERHLAGKSQKDLLREKTDGVQPRALPVSLRIKRYPGPQAELDLHGDTARRAVEKTALFIESSRHHGLLTLRIIVGRGSHSSDGPVLPDAVAGKLSELKSSGRILDFRWERQGRSKSGAVIVYLNTEV